MSLDLRYLRKQLREKGRIDRLKNGVVLISEHTPKTGLVRGRIEINAGSAHEEEKDHGIMHLLEHMVFNGSQRYPDPAQGKIVAGLLGLDLDAQTCHESTNYPVRGINCPYLLEGNFGAAWEFMQDSVFHPSLMQGMLQKERTIIVNEIKKREAQTADPYSKRMDQIQGRLYRNNPWQFKNGVGTEETLAQITADTLRRYHSKYYVGSNCLIVLDGDLGRDRSLLERIKEQAEMIPVGEPATQIRHLPEDPLNGTEVLNFSSNQILEGELCMVSLYFQIQRTDRKPLFALNMLNAVLGAGSHSVLFDCVRERNRLVYDIGSRIEGHEQTGYLKVSYAVLPQNLDAAIQKVDDCLRQVKQGKFDDSLIQVYLAGSLPELLANYQGSGWIMCELLNQYSSERAGRPHLSFEDKIRKSTTITKRDVVHAANQYLSDDRLLVIVRPE